jgi:hypothetical protein
MCGRRFLLALGVMLAFLASAEAGEPGQVRAQSFAAMPAGATIVVQPEDDSVDNVELAQVIGDFLARKGQKVAAQGARLTLSFATSVVAADEGGGGLTLGETSASDYTDRVVTAPQGDGAQITSPEPTVPQGLGRQILDSDIRVNVWSSSRDSLLQGRVSGSERVSKPRYILSAILSDAETGQQLWRGESAIDGATVSDAATFRNMAPALFGYLGRDARGEQFWID